MPIRRSISPTDCHGALGDLSSEIRKLQPDVLHGHGAKGGAIARLIGSALRVNRYRVCPPLFAAWRQPAFYRASRLAGRAVLRHGALAGIF